MKRIICLLLLLGLLGLIGCGAALADTSGACGENVSWSFNAQSGALTIGGTGPMDNYSYLSEIPWSGIRSSIRQVAIGEGVTSIGVNAFLDCLELESVAIADTVTEIGPMAFRGCMALAEATIPGSVTGIGFQAFRGCTELASVTVLNPNAVIGDGSLDVFRDCPADLKLRGFDGSTAQDYAASASQAGLPGGSFVNLGAISGSCGDHVTWAFDPVTRTLNIQGTGPMQSFFLSSKWDKIRSLVKKISIGSGVTEIGDYAFYDFSSLTQVTIPNGVTRIGEYAFEYCTGLTQVSIPNTVTTLGYGVFEGCAGLTTVNIPNGVKDIDNYMFYNCNALAQITIPGGATRIGYAAFRNCTALTQVTIPGSVVRVGSEAFRGCTGLKRATLMDGVTEIGEYAFSGCTGLKRMSIPASVTHIEPRAFENCSNMGGFTVFNPSATLGDEELDVLWGTNVYLVLQGYPGSTLETYADQVNRTFLPLPVEPPQSTLYLPAGLTAIDSESFIRTRAEAVVIPGSVTFIGYDPFYESSIKYIYGFRGSAAEELTERYPRKYAFIPIDENWLASH